jgi:hypothetical protein
VVVPITRANGFGFNWSAANFFSSDIDFRPVSMRMISRLGMVLHFFSQLRQQFGLMLADQGLNHLLQSALHDVVQFVQG